MSKGLYRLKEAAEYLSMHPKKLGRYCLLGKVKAIRVGAQWRIPTSEVERIVREGIR